MALFNIFKSFSFVYLIWLSSATVSTSESKEIRTNSDILYVSRHIYLQVVWLDIVGEIMNGHQSVNLITFPISIHRYQQKILIRHVGKSVYKKFVVPIIK